jgi:hypothetical protein
MAQFDIVKWKQRVTQKHSSEPTDLSQKLKQVESLGDLISWCEARGLTVRFVRKSGGTYLGEKKLVTLASRADVETQLYLLLHECGHFLIGGRDKTERFGMGYSMEDEPGIKRKFVHKIDVVDEEFEAWHRGLKLGTRLGLCVDKERYDVIRCKYLRTYLKWALNVDGFGREDDDEQEVNPD